MIEMKNVSKSYSYTKRNVLNEISFKIETAEYCALIGNNGCGKTTIIKILSNLINYDSGDVIIDNTKLTENFVSYKAKWGIVLSKPYYIDEFSVKEYLTFVAKFQKVKSGSVDDRITDLLTILDLKKSETQKIKALSSGNQMKVSIASALIHNPDVLVMDEPFVNLDVNSTNSIINLLESVRKTKTVIVTSHNLDVLIGICNRFLIMNGGTIVKDLRKSDFASEVELKDAVKLILTNDPQHSSIGDWLK